MGLSMNEVEENLQAFLVSKSAEVLKIDAGEVQWDADIDEYGFDSMEVNRFCVELNKHFSISIQPVLFLEVTSLAELSRYLLENFPAQIEQRCL